MGHGGEMAMQQQPGDSDRLGGEDEPVDHAGSDLGLDCDGRFESERR
jgi:hypothetical protein